MKRLILSFIFLAILCRNADTDCSYKEIRDYVLRQGLLSFSLGFASGFSANVFTRNLSLKSNIAGAVGALAGFAFDKIAAYPLCFYVYVSHGFNTYDSYVEPGTYLFSTKKSIPDAQRLLETAGGYAAGFVAGRLLNKTMAKIKKFITNFTLI